MRKRYGHLQKQRNGNKNLESLNNGYFESIEYFRQRYCIEKRRAERKKYEFSLIVIDLNDEESRLQRDINNTSPKEVEDVLFTTLKMILRSTDVIVKYCPYKLVILLPDTDQIGIKLVIQRINDTLKEISKKIFWRYFQKH
jgi:GGDEF domain-containing protein